MSRNYSLTTAIVFGVALSLVADGVNAQILRRRVAPTYQQNATATQSQPTMAPMPGQMPGQMTEQTAGQHDLFLAHWIGADNQCEIELNQFASQRASSEEVKNFAQEMIRAHGELATKLNQAVANQNPATVSRDGQVNYSVGYRGVAGAVATAPDPAAAANPATPAIDAPQAPAASGAAAQATKPASGAQATASAAGNQVGTSTTTSANVNSSAATMSSGGPIEFKREINGEMVKIIEQKLGDKKGQEFDQCFMTGQVAGHVHMIATLEAAQKSASPQLKPVLDEAVSVAQKHLEHAEAIVAKLIPHDAR